MDKTEVIKALENGEIIRLTSGIWNNPEKSGIIAKSIEQINRFYNSYYKITAQENKDGIIDVQGATYCDMY